MIKKWNNGTAKIYKTCVPQNEMIHIFAARRSQDDS